MRAMAERMAKVDLYVGSGQDLSITNLTGHPTVVFPMGFRDRDGRARPGSVTLTGRLFDESTLLAVAHAFQQATGDHLRRPPLERYLAEDAGSQSGRTAASGRRRLIRSESRDEERSIRRAWIRRLSAAGSRLVAEPDDEHVGTRCLVNREATRPALGGLTLASLFTIKCCSQASQTNRSSTVTASRPRLITMFT